MSWTADENSVVIGISAAGSAKALLSLDPSVTYSAWVTPSLATVSTSFHVTTDSAGILPVQLNIPVPAGETIYCSFSAAVGTVTVYLDEDK